MEVRLNVSSHEKRVLREAHQPGRVAVRVRPCPDLQAARAEEGRLRTRRGPEGGVGPLGPWTSFRERDLRAPQVGVITRPRLDLDRVMTIAVGMKLAIRASEQHTTA